MKLIALCFLLLSFLGGAAQPRQGQALLDSLLNETPHMREDTMAVLLLDNISYEYCRINPNEGLAYAEKELALARKIGWKRGEAMAYNEYGINYLNKAAYPEALEYFFKALRLNEEIGNKVSSARASLNIGTVYFNQKLYNKALEYNFRSLKAAREAHNIDLEIIVSGNIGNIFYAQEAYPDALVYMQKALHLSDSMNDTRGIINQWSNIANVYAELGNPEESLVYSLKALELARKEGDLQMIAASEGNIGETYLDIAKAAAANKNGDAKKASIADNLALAVAYLQKGIVSARAIHFNPGVTDFTRTLSEAYALQGNYEGALTAYQQYVALNDSIFNLENSEKIAGLETKRAIELKDKDLQIARLQLSGKRNERMAFIGGITLLLMIVAILFRNFRRQQHSNTMLSKEKKRSDDLLLNILPAEIAEELKETGSAQARQYDEVSVLFTDFVNFTGRAQKLSPQMLVSELNECFTAFDAIIARAGLEKIKTIGDAYMAVFGLPVSDPRHAEKAILAAMEIRSFIAERRKQEGSFEIRIGINSGPVVAGIVGVKKFAYDIWGDTVNTAARMEQYGEPGAINISQSTYELVKDKFRCAYRGMIAAKHKGEVEMYFVYESVLAEM